MNKPPKTKKKTSLAVQINALLKPHGLQLVDRADGCRGHYCIQRYIPGTNGKYVEHWNENKGGHWNAFGTVYTDVRQALGQAWLILGANANVDARQTQDSDTPLSVRIENNQLVIRIGIDRLDGHDCHPDFPELPITDRRQWARDVAYELERDRGDGASPVSLLLEAAMKEAMEMGSSAIDYKRPTARDIDGEPCLVNVKGEARADSATPITSTDLFAGVEPTAWFADCSYPDGRSAGRSYFEHPSLLGLYQPLYSKEDVLKILEANDKGDSR